jgi:hypothetical protein
MGVCLQQVAVKPAARTSDRSQLTRYGILDERIIADALIEPSICVLGGLPPNREVVTKLRSAIDNHRAQTRND